MIFEDFKNLTNFDQIQLVNKRFTEMKESNIPDKEFKCKELEFSLKTVLDYFATKGYVRYDNSIIRRLTALDMDILKEIASESHNYYRIAHSLGANITVDRGDDPIQATTIRVHKSVWDRWNNFCKQKSAISKEELISSALEEFIKKYSSH